MSHESKIFLMNYILILLSCFYNGFSSADNDPVIGIDLGTTYSCVAIYEYDRVTVIHNEHGNLITPSMVSFTKDGERLFCEEARNHIVFNPKNTVYGVKRIIGRPYNDEIVQNAIEKFPFDVVDVDNKPIILVVVNGKITAFTAEQISGMVLGHMKMTAEEYLGKTVSKAVITVPAYFNDAQRQATKDAAAIAGLTVLRLVNEPTAAAIAYGIDRIKQHKTILVYDLGGGTFDVSLFKIEDQHVKVLATSGDLLLGGEDFDDKLVGDLLKIYKEKTGKDLSEDHERKQTLRREAEKAKRTLSSKMYTKIEIPYFYEGKHFSERVSRALFEGMNSDLFNLTLRPVEKVLSSTQTKIKDLDEILLVGGSTRIPEIQRILKHFFKGKNLSKAIQPDLAVASGAALLAAHISGANLNIEKLVIDVIPYSLGIEVFNNFGDDLLFDALIPANTPIPARFEKFYTTVSDNQTEIDVTILEGDKRYAKDNTKIGDFVLSNLERGPAGTPNITIEFDLDENGILTVTARDTKTGSKNQATVKYDEHRLNHEDLKKMVNQEAQMRKADLIFLTSQQDIKHEEL